MTKSGCIETKAQSSQWKEPEKPRPKKALQVQSNVTALLTVLLDYYNDMVHGAVILQGSYATFA